MRKDSANVNFLAVVVNSGDEPRFVAAEVENCELTDLVSGWEVTAEFGKIGVVFVLCEPIPVFQRGAGFRMFSGKFVQTFSGDDMHGGGVILPLRSTVFQIEARAKQKE